MSWTQGYGREQFDLAWNIMEHTHDGQVDKAGVPYIEHPITIASWVDSYEAKATALLHDVLEDTSTTADDLREAGIDDIIIEAVSALTRQKDETYLCDYINRVKDNDLASKVKVADLLHNLDITRIKDPTSADLGRMSRYVRALRMLVLDLDCCDA